LEYTTETLDRASGDLIIKSLGEWITVTEYGQAKGEGPRKTRAILKEMGLLAPEHFGQSDNVRYRLTPRAVAEGLGKRIQPKIGKYPFDVLSPLGQRWADERWTEASHEIEAKSLDSPTKRLAKVRLGEFIQSRCTAMTPQMEICWLLDCFPKLLQSDICDILGVPKQTVSRYAGIRSSNLMKARAKMTAPLAELETSPVNSSGDLTNGQDVAYELVCDGVTLRTL
jgi:hypothetical protein